MNDYEPMGDQTPPSESQDPNAAPACEFSTAPEQLPAPRNLRPAKKQIASVALAVSFIVLFSSVVQVAFMLVVNTFAPELASKDWYTIVMSMLPMYVFAMPASLLIYQIGSSDPPEPKRMNFGTWLGVLAICFALTYIGNIIGTVVNFIIGVFSGEAPTNELQDLTMSTPFWANLLFCGILAPILEEIFYRKLVIDRLRTFGDLPAVLISGILFGSIHGNFSQFFYAAILGILFGFIYLRTGKLRYTVGLHMAINLVGGVYSTEMLRLLDMEAFSANPIAYFVENPAPVTMLLVYFAFILICFVCAPIAVALLWKHIRFRKADAPLSPSQWLRVLLLNPATWLCLGVVVLLFVG